MRIPFLRAPLNSFKEKMAVINVMSGNNVSVGPETKQFEYEFGKYIDVPYALSVCNGSIALELIWQTFITTGQLKKGDHVLLPSFTFVAVANAIVNAGLVPIFCDINKNTWNIEINGFECGINDIKAICVVHTFGNPCDVTFIKRFCDNFGILLVEDCAEACGAEYQGKKVGGFGHASAFSFNATKNMTTGEGGMVCFQDWEDEAAALLLKENGFGYSSGRDAILSGHNYRLSNLQCAIGIEQLKTLDERNKKRALNIVNIYKKLVDIEDRIFPQTMIIGNKNVFQIAGLVVPENKRDILFEHLIKNGVEAKKYFDPPIHKQVAYKEYSKSTLPITNDISKRIICLPFDSYLTSAEITYMTTKIMEVL